MHRLAAWCRSSRFGLIVLALACVPRGVAYLPIGYSVPTPPPHWFETMLTYPIWGGVWIVVGLFCLVAVAARWLTAVAVGMVFALHVASGTAIMCGLFLTDGVGDWSRALNYFSIATLILWAWSRGKAGNINVKIRG